MTHAVPQPSMRLVGAYDEAQLADWAAHREARHAIALENRRAAANPQIDPSDPRWVLAVQTQANLQGTMLTPEHRARIMKTARAIGVRPFDANLIMAIVQDHARCGRSLHEAQGVLTLIRKPQSRRLQTMTLRWVSALSAAVAGTLLLIWMLTQT